MDVTLIIRSKRSIDACINRIGKKTNTSPEEIENLRSNLTEFAENFSETPSSTEITLDLQNPTSLNVFLISINNGIEKRYFTRFIKEDGVWRRIHTWFDPRKHDVESE